MNRPSWGILKVAERRRILTCVTPTLAWDVSSKLFWLVPVLRYSWQRAHKQTKPRFADMCTLLFVMIGDTLQLTLTIQFCILVFNAQVDKEFPPESFNFNVGLLPWQICSDVRFAVLVEQKFDLCSKYLAGDDVWFCYIEIRGRGRCMDMVNVIGSPIIWPGHGPNCRRLRQPCHMSHVIVNTSKSFITDFTDPGIARMTYSRFGSNFVVLFCAVSHERA